MRPYFLALLLNLESECFAQTRVGVYSLTIGCRVLPEKWKSIISPFWGKIWRRKS